MTSENTNEEVIETEELVETSPGELLGNRREELGLELQYVADQLHITMHYVRSLESNAYDKLPGDIFVRGYIRSYANLLKLDPDTLVSGYQHYVSHRVCVEQSVKKTKRRRRNDKNLPWFIVSAIALVSVAIALWYFNADKSESEPSATSLPVLSAPNGAVTQRANTSLRQSVDLGMPASAAAPAMPAENNIDATEPVDSVVQDVATEEPSEAPVEIDAAVVSQGDAQSADATPTEVILAVAAQLPEIPAQVLPIGNIINIDAGGEDVLKITFSGESIVQIDDGSEKQIYRDIRAAGDVLEVTGTAPFNILLGDAASTALTLNGNIIDFKTSIRVDNSARLTIGL